MPKTTTSTKRKKPPIWRDDCSFILNIFSVLIWFLFVYALPGAFILGWGIGVYAMLTKSYSAEEVYGVFLIPILITGFLAWLNAPKLLKLSEYKDGYKSKELKEDIEKEILEYEESLLTEQNKFLIYSAIFFLLIVWGFLVLIRCYSRNGFFEHNGNLFLFGLQIVFVSLVFIAFIAFFNRYDLNKETIQRTREKYPI